jgi:hypothetical protein
MSKLFLITHPNNSSRADGITHRGWPRPEGFRGASIGKTIRVPEALGKALLIALRIAFRVAFREALRIALQ